MKIYTKEWIMAFDRGIRVQPHRVTVEREHLHEFIEAVYIMDGTGVHGIDGMEYRVRRGCLLFINYRQVHYFRADEKMEIWDVLIDPEWLSEKLIEPENAFELLTLSDFSGFQQKIDTESPLVHFQGAERVRLEQLLRDMYEEQEHSFIGRETVLKAQANILLTLIFRKMSINQEAEGFRLTPEFLQYIREHCAEKLTLEDLSKSCFYNPSYFSRLFKEHYGMTLTEFLSNTRLEKAQQLLEQTSLSVEEIALQSGFSGRNAFYKLFKERTGLTPQGYRKVKNQDKQM